MRERRKQLKKNDNKTSWNEKGNSASATVDQVSTLQEALDILQVDTRVWEVEQWTAKTYDAYIKDDKNDDIKTKTLFSIHIRFKRVSYLDFEDLTTQLISRLQNETPVYDKAFSKIGDEEANLLIINLADLHVDKLSFKEEVHSDQTFEILRQEILSSLQKLIDRSSSYRIKEVMFPLGNDFFNSDRGEPPTTTRGTPQSSHLMWHQTFVNGWLLVVEMLEILSKLGPVYCPIILGNHDREKCFYLGEVIKAYFSNNSTIEIDNRPTPRKYKLYGNNLIGLDHGERKKPQELHRLMSVEAAELWSQSIYRYLYCGHVHHEKVVQFVNTLDTNGVIVKYLPSLTQTDSWHAQQGYVGTIRSCKAHVHSYQEGLTAEFSVNLRLHGIKYGSK